MKAHWVKNEGMRRKALNEPCVIVTTSGMLQGGPIHYYLKHLHDDENSKLFLTGFQVEGTPGRVLMETGKITIDGEVLDIKMQVGKYDFSAHSDRKGLFETVEKLSPEKIILVHGDAQVVEVFKSDLQALGFEVFAPKVGDEIIL